MYTAVTGATGFLGRHLVQALVDGGRTVRALVRDPQRAKVLPKQVARHTGDLTDEASLRGLADGVDVVFHLGAATTGGWEVHEEATVRGTERLLRMCADASVTRFVHVSSIVAYDTKSLHSGDTITESCPLAAPDPAIGPYARGKIEAEKVVCAFARNDDMSITIVRPGLVYGPEHIIFQHLGSRIGGWFVGVGGGKLLLPLTYVGNVVDALLRVAETPATSGKAYHVVDEDNTTRSDYTQLLSELTGQRYRSLHLPKWPVALACGALGRLRRLPGLSRLPDTSASKIRTRALSIRYDTTALRDATGWRPPHSLPESLSGILSAPTAAIGCSDLVRVGIIGAGNIAELHLRGLQEIHGVEVVGVLDTKPGAAEEFAHRFGVKRHFQDPRRFYDEAKPQIVHVLTPPQTHHAVTLDALKRQVHVLAEKPIATTLDECDAMQTAAEAAGVTLGVDHNFLFDPRVRLAQQRIEQGAVGDVIHVDTIFGFDVRRTRHFSAEPGNQSHWSYRLPGGLLEDLLPHPLYVTLAFLGEESRLIDSHIQTSGRLTESLADEVRLFLTRQDVTANITLSLSIHPDVFTVAIYGTRGTIKLDIQNMLLQRFRLGRGPKALARGLSVVGGGFDGVFQTMRNVVSLAARRTRPPGDVGPLIRAHYVSLIAGREVPVGHEEGKHVVQIIRQVWPI